MDIYAALFDLAKLLLSEDDTRGVADTILLRLVELAGAERGFIVVRDGSAFDGSAFEVKRDVRFERSRVTAEERRVSRRLVRQVIDTREPFVSENVLTDMRLARVESIEHAGARAVLVVPLARAGEVYGVVYLDRASADGGFGEGAVQIVADGATLAGLLLHRTLERDELRKRMQSFERDLSARHDFQGIVTRDEKMVSLLKMVTQVAASDATALITGETGTGKELVARAIHANSPRAGQPFIVLHCTALPATLLESELFGHVRGAFTGADKERPGRVAAAHGGTLFLDEIAEIPADLQAKLLRFLQFGEVQRLGSDRVEKVDVRVVAATHRPLRAMVDSGAFRRDLYYRLNVVELRVPALRERLGDVPLLVDAFLREPLRGLSGRAQFTTQAMAMLAAHDYPGNVRELRHIVERARVLATGPALDVSLLPPELVPIPEEAAAAGDEPPTVPASLAKVRENAVRAAEQAFLRDLLDCTGGNISQAAREAGIHRSYLQRLMSRHGLRSG